MWTLRECIDYALEHNITINKNRVAEEAGESNLAQYKSQLWPSLTFSTMQNVTYRPLQDDITTRTVDGQVTISSNKVTGNSNYNLAMNWTVWNGGVNYLNVRNQRITNKIAEQTTETSEKTIQEQITQFYVQILFSKEAEAVNERLAETARRQWERGQEMMNQGQMSRADVVQLEAQKAAAEYNIVAAKTQTANYRRQLKSSTWRAPCLPTMPQWQTFLRLRRSMPRPWLQDPKYAARNSVWSRQNWPTTSPKEASTPPSP